MNSKRRVGDQVRDMRAEFHVDDIDELLGLEDDALLECMTACRAIYGKAYKLPSRPTRLSRVRTILESRRSFSELTPTERADIEVSMDGQRIEKEPVVV